MRHKVSEGASDIITNTDVSELPVAHHIVSEGASVIIISQPLMYLNSLWLLREYGRYLGLLMNAFGIFTCNMTCIIYVQSG